MASQSSQAKVLVIGFDALDYELFSKRRPAGMTLHPLFAPIPVTGPSWTSIYTGDGMASHGVRHVFGMQFRRCYARNARLDLLLWRLHNLARIARAKPPRQKHLTYLTTESTYVWDTLGAAGVKVKTVNMPITSPAKEVNGIQVSGFPLLSGRRWFCPESVGPDLPGNYRELSDMLLWYSDPEFDSHRLWKERAGRAGSEEVEGRTRTTAHALADLFVALPRADVEMVQFSFVDRMGHVFGMSGETEEFCYDLVGRLVAKLAAEAPAESVMIVSDHGFQGSGHTDYGCLGLVGPLAEAVKVREGYTPSVLDVAPTLAGYLACRHECEGNDLTVEDDYVTRDTDAEKEEKQRMIKQLTDLGYM
jgi:hypothetical protein